MFKKLISAVDVLIYKIEILKEYIFMLKAGIPDSSCPPITEAENKIKETFRTAPQRNWRDVEELRGIF
jgi:hypothetical protein